MRSPGWPVQVHRDGTRVGLNATRALLGGNGAILAGIRGVPIQNRPRDTRRDSGRNAGLIFLEPSFAKQDAGLDVRPDQA